MPKYERLKSELQGIDPSDGEDAIDRLCDRVGLYLPEGDSVGVVQADAEQAVIGDSFRREYPALGAMGDRILEHFGQNLTEGEQAVLETVLCLSLIGLREIVTFDELPHIDS